MRKLLATLTALLLFTGALLAQKTVTGTVTDDKGNPIPNVSVVVKGTPTGTVTKADGTFSLTFPASAKQIELSSLGFGTQTVNIGSGSVYNVSLTSTGARKGKTQNDRKNSLFDPVPWKGQFSNPIRCSDFSIFLTLPTTQRNQ